MAEAVEFDIDSKITENINLYAIYSPKIEKISSITTDSIEIVLSSNKVYPLEDGSYAGIKFLHSTTDSDYQDLELSIPTNYKDIESKRYLTYSFKEPLTSGSHYFKVTYGHTYEYKSVYISE